MAWRTTRRTSTPSNLISTQVALRRGVHRRARLVGGVLVAGRGALRRRLRGDLRADRAGRGARRGRALRTIGGRRPRQLRLVLARGGTASVDARRSCASRLALTGGVVVAEIDGVAKEGRKHGGTAATALLLNAAEVALLRRLRRGRRRCGRSRRLFDILCHGGNNKRLQADEGGGRRDFEGAAPYTVEREEATSSPSSLLRQVERDGRRRGRAAGGFGPRRVAVVRDER